MYEVHNYNYIIIILNFILVVVKYINRMIIIIILV